jgi:hypothetical protein
MKDTAVLPHQEPQDVLPRPEPEWIRTASEKAAFFALASLPLSTMVKIFQVAVKNKTSELSRENVDLLLTARAEPHKLRVERQSGRSISTEQAAERLQITPEGVRKRIAKGTLIGYPAMGDGRNRMRLPEWQFAAPNVVHDWVPAVIEAYGTNGWALLDFLTTPLNGEVAGRRLLNQSLLDLAQAGDVAFMLEAARAANPA